MDTNLLVRLFTADDRDQEAVARSFFRHCQEAGEQLHVSAIVLCELVWVLGRGRYRKARAELVRALQAIVETVNLTVQDRDLVEAALGDFREGPGDFADYLIRRLDARAGCVDTVTFDGDLESSAGFTVLRSEDYPQEPPPPSFVHEP